VGFHKFETPTNFQNHLISQELNDRPKNSIWSIKKDLLKHI
jgi:hypothetical protein